MATSVSPIDASSPKKEREDNDEELILTPPPEHKADLVSNFLSKDKGLPPKPPKPLSPGKKAQKSPPAIKPKPKSPALSPTGSKASVQTLDEKPLTIVTPANQDDSIKNNNNNNLTVNVNDNFLNESIEQIELSRQQIDLAASELASTTHSPSIPLIESLKKLLQVPCCNEKLPFTLKGGSEKALMISIDAVLHPDLFDKLNSGDLLLTIEKNDIPGMILKDANILLQTLLNSCEQIEIEYVSQGKIPTDLRAVLTDKTWEAMHTTIRDNVYARSVPYTTRLPKSNEIDGTHYKFVSVERFVELQRSEMLLEQGCYQGHFYGTPRPDDFDESSTGFAHDNLLEEEQNSEPLNLDPLDNMVNAMAILPEQIDNDRGPLPPNWEVGYSELGEKYFIDHNTGTTQWEDPRELLPEGWVRMDDATYGTYYVDHNNKKTQYERPTFGGNFHSKPQANNGINGNGTQSHGNVHHFSGASSSNFLNGNNTNGWNSQPPPPPTVYNMAHQPPPPQQQQHQHQSQKQHLHQNGIVKNQSLNSQHHQHMSPRGAMGYAFTTDISELQGELITTRVQKGSKGLGFTLIGNDGTSSQPEFLQVTKIFQGGPAAMDNILHPGDVLVYVNDEMMLGATQDDACKIFRMIPIGDYVTLQVCRGYPLLLDPTNKIITENVYTPPLNHHHRPRETSTIQITKGERGYGFTITDTMQGQRVKSVLYPDQCPNLLEGDIIMEIDGQNARHKPHLDVIEQLRNHPLGYKTTMIVSRNSPKHRSRTPTAAFRYGEQRATPVPVVQPRSKTPAPVPVRPNKSSAIRQYHPKNTLPKQSNVDKPDIYENASRMRPSSTTLGFASTPNYVPISAFAHDKPQGHQLITVNLIKRADGFGFRLVGGQESNNPLIVGQVVPGGAAALDGRLKPNDEIIEIDGQNVEYSTHKDVVEKIRKAGDVGHVKLVVRRIREDLPRSTSLPFSYNYSNPMNGGPSQNEIPQLPMATAHPATADSTYHVDLAKLDSEDFGCTIVSLNNRYIGNIIPDSPADKCGRLHPGDCVIAINRTPLYNLSHQQVIHYIKNSGNTITFTIDPAKRIPAPINTMPAFQVDHLRSNQATPSQMYQQMPHRRFSNNYYASPNAEHGSLIRVELPRGNKGFGFSIRGGWEFEQMPLRILKVADDGPAAANGNLRVGDLIVKINGESTLRMTHERAIQLIKEQPVVRLLVQRPILYPVMQS